MFDLPEAPDPGDVLSQPTRRRLFALLAELSRPAGTAELAGRLALHPNGVRLHLERLADAGLIDRARVRQSRGRPSDVWALAAGAAPGGRPPHAYHDLGRWLARALKARPGGLRGIEETGRQIGRELVRASAAPSEHSGATREALETSLIALGFQPSIAEQDGDRLTVRLRNCPYRDAVRENQPAICALHEGITRGLIDVLEPRARLTGFVPNDPDRAGCVIELQGFG